jgi:thymidylate synthase
MKNGMQIVPETGSKVTSKDMCSKITLHGNAIGQMLNSDLHKDFPTKGKHCGVYITEYDRKWVAEQNALPEGDNRRFIYNYMDRFINYPYKEDELIIDQLKQLRENMKTCGISRRQQIITWQPVKDMFSVSPPCLQRIWIRELEEDPEDGQANTEVHFDWRSRDLFGAWMSNYVGLMNMLYKEIFTPLDLKVVKLVDNCNSLHIYSTDWEAANLV